MPEISQNAIKATNGTGTAISLTPASNTCTANITNNLSNRNLVINGAMRVAQRGASFTSVTATAYHLDRFQYNLNGTVGAATVTQNSVTDLAGFANSLKIDCTTADASLAAGDRLTLRYAFEGQDLQQIAKGLSGAKQLTLSFYIKATKTGTQIVELFDHDNTRHCAKSVTISQSNTWEKKTITYPADTTGAFDDDNANSLSIFFGIACGTDYTSGTLATTWAANTNANRFVGQVNHFDNTANNFEITGVQLEVSDYATEFEHLSYGDELLRCQRYLRVYGGHAAYQRIGIGYFSNSSRLECPLPLAPKMRTTPTMTVSSAGHWKAESPSGSGEFTSVGLDGNSSPQVAIVWGDKSSSFTAGESGRYLADNTTDARIYLSAEL